MCGRFTLAAPSEVLKEVFGLDQVVSLTARYNIAPTQDAACVIAGGPAGKDLLVMLRWGLVPSWAKDTALGSKLINARAETVHEKASFRSAFRRQRCLVLADGFYEWTKAPGGPKQPYWFHRADGMPFAFAGLWERWTPADGKEIRTFTIITTEANEIVRAVHERMPVILDPDNHGLWLNAAEQERAKLQQLLKPCSSAEMARHPVGPWVNNPRLDEPGCIAPLPA